MDPTQFNTDSFSSLMDEDPLKDLLLTTANEEGKNSPFSESALRLDEASPFSSYFSSDAATSPSSSASETEQRVGGDVSGLELPSLGPAPIASGVDTALASLQSLRESGGLVAPPPLPPASAAGSAGVTTTAAAAPGSSSARAPLKSGHALKIRDVRRKASGPPLSQWTLRRALGDNLGRLEGMVESGVTLLSLDDMHGRMQDWNLITERADGTLEEDSLRGRISKHTLRDALDESYGMLREIDHAYLPYLVRELHKRRKRSEHQQRINRERRAKAKAARLNQA